MPPSSATTDLHRHRTWFMLISMGLSIGMLVFNAFVFKGWVSATLWSVGFTVLYGGYALGTRDRLTIHFWLFALLVGFAELPADAWLVNHTQTLLYPGGEPMLWQSPAYMPFAWTVVLMQVGYIGYLLVGRFGMIKAMAMTAVLGALLVPVYEFLAIHADWWSYHSAPMLGPVPVYIIIAEGLLMLSVPPLFMAGERLSLKYTPLLAIAQGLVMFLACIIAWTVAG